MFMIGGLGAKPPAQFLVSEGSVLTEPARPERGAATSADSRKTNSFRSGQSLMMVESVIVVPF